MQDLRLSRGAVVGGVAASATTGALVAMGHRAGSAALPFAAIGAVLFQRTPSSGAVGLVLTGLVLHVIGIVVWSAAFVWIAERGITGHFAAAALVGIGQFLFAWLVAESSGHGLASVLSLGDLLVVSLVLALSLVVGIRLAFSSRVPHDRPPPQGPHQL